MKSAPTFRQEQAADRIARQITVRLTEGEALLPYEVTERLRASRERAVSERRREISVLHTQTSTAASAHGHTMTMGTPENEGSGWWRTLVSAIPVFALIAGLGFLPGALCPHFSSEAGRETSFVELVRLKGVQPAYAVDDSVALHFKNGRYHETIHNNAKKSAYDVTTAPPYLTQLSQVSGG